MTTQTVQQEEFELQTPGPTPSTSGTFDFGTRTPDKSTTHLHTTAAVGTDNKGGANGSHRRSQVSAGEDEPQEGAVEVAPEGGYGWVVVAACSVAM
jgi:hypothetical protein